MRLGDGIKGAPPTSPREAKKERAKKAQKAMLKLSIRVLKPPRSDSKRAGNEISLIKGEKTGPTFKKGNARGKKHMPGTKT